jgi:osmotically-inducible protein OsmY
MSISFRKQSLINGAVVGSAAVVLAGFSLQAGAQAVDASALNQQAAAAQSTPSADSVAAAKLMRRVKEALHSDPYFYDAHVSVSVENGAVVLRGFVSSDWDLRDAIRIASTAADGRRVVDNLSIKEGGNRQLRVSTQPRPARKTYSLRLAR